LQACESAGVFVCRQRCARDSSVSLGLRTSAAAAAAAAL